MKANSAGKHITVQADVSRKKDVEAMFANSCRRSDRLTCWSTTRDSEAGPSHEIDAADFDRVIGVNLRGPFLCARAAIRHFLTRNGHGGVILNNSSVHEIIPKPKYLSYSITKGGMENMTKSLALEYADRGIRVNAVGPGAIVDPINRAWIDNPKPAGRWKATFRGTRGGCERDCGGVCVPRFR